MAILSWPQTLWRNFTLCIIKPPFTQRQTQRRCFAYFVTSAWDIFLERISNSQPFSGPLSRTTRVSRYQKGKPNLDFTGARDSEWQWHQLEHMQVYTSLQRNNHASISPLSFFYRLGALPATQPTASKHWRQTVSYAARILIDKLNVADTNKTMLSASSDVFLTIFAFLCHDWTVYFICGKKVAHTRLPSVGFHSWSRFLAVSLQVTWVINPAVDCHYFPPGL